MNRQSRLARACASVGNQAAAVTSFAFRSVPGPESLGIGLTDVRELIRGGRGRWGLGVVDRNREASRVAHLRRGDARMQAGGADLSAGKVENAERRDQRRGTAAAAAGE